MNARAEVSSGRFDGKTVVITEGTGGIGSEVARGVVTEGGSVLLVARDEARLAERVSDFDTIARRPNAAAFFVADAGSQPALSAAAEAAISRFGRIDGWVHAVGSILLKPLSATREDDFSRQFDLNAGSAFRVLLAGFRDRQPEPGHEHQARLEQVRHTGERVPQRLASAFGRPSWLGNRALSSARLLGCRTVPSSPIAR